MGVVSLAMLSWSATTGVATLMYFNPKLKEHPGELIFLMCLCEGVAVWSTLIQAIGTETVICYFEMDKSLMLTAGFWFKDQATTVTFLTESNFILQHFFQLLSLSLNFCLCLDIVLTMSSPFSPHDRRMKFYIIMSGCIATIATKMTMGSRIILKFSPNGLVNPEEL